MLFHSLSYLLLFLPVVLVGYFALNHFCHVQAGKIWLVLASFFFYCQWVPAFGLLLCFSILCNYSFGRLIHCSGQQGSQQQGRERRVKAWLLVAIVFNLGLLAYYKYANFVVDNLALLTGLPLTLAKIVLPLGISFFTFTQLAYLVDVYRRVAHEYRLLHYFLFVTYFPHLIAGPILHHREMMPQFADPANKALNWENIFKGLFLFSMGLFKKVVIADSFAQWANAGFHSDHALQFHEAWATSLSYSLQIYFDFSGYTDMAIGAALMFNIYFPLNFNSPYKARNIQEFWRRWHMTLSRWLRDYVYIPLGGNRQGASRTYVHLGLTFLLGGLWHGANWTFILWGALHGLASGVHKFWQGKGFSLPAPVGVVITFLFVNVAWVFFGAESIHSALRVLRGMAGLNGFAASLWFGETGWLSALTEQASFYYTLGGMAAVCFLGITWLLPNSVEIVDRYATRSVLPVAWTCFLLASVLFLLTFVSSRINEFIYFNF